MHLTGCLRTCLREGVNLNTIGILSDGLLGIWFEDISLLLVMAGTRVFAVLFPESCIFLCPARVFMET